MTDMAAHIVDDTEGADIMQLARTFSTPIPAPLSQRRRRIIPLVRSAAQAAGGTTSDLVNARVVRQMVEAIADPSAPETEAVDDAVALLREIAPRDLREALLVRRLVALDNLAMETIQLARASKEYPMLYAAYADQAVALSKAATELDEALERRRGRGQRVVEVKHVVVHNGGQAIVGPVTTSARRLHPRPADAE
jgi:hypothetical protein